MHSLRQVYYCPYLSAPAHRNCRRAATTAIRHIRRLRSKKRHFGQRLCQSVRCLYHWHTINTERISNTPASKLVYTADQYHQAFHIDQNAKASFLGIGGGSDDVHFGMETGKSESAFDIVVEVYSDRDSDTVDNVKWDAPYDTMIASGNPAKIQTVRASCGDR